MNSQQVLPRAKVTVESQALRDLVACDYLALDRLVALVCALADASTLLSRLDMHYELGRPMVLYDLSDLSDFVTEFGLASDTSFAICYLQKVPGTRVKDDSPGVANLGNPLRHGRKIKRMRTTAGRRQDRGARASRM